MNISLHVLMSVLLLSHKSAECLLAPRDLGRAVWASSPLLAAEGRTVDELKSPAIPSRLQSSRSLLLAAQAQGIKLLRTSQHPHVAFEHVQPGWEEDSLEKMERCIENMEQRRQALLGAKILYRLASTFITHA